MIRSSRIALCLIGLLASCSSTFERRDWSNYTGPGAEHFHKEELVFPHVDDPLEPFNRVSAGVNYAFIRYLYSPFTAIYRHFVPIEIRDRVAQAGDNLLEPGRIINNLLQGKWEDGGEETLRFLVNTTVGVLGLFDPATKWGLEKHKEDFGQTFAHWGWDHSTYLYIPIFGPSTIRDGLGLAPEWWTYPANADWRIAAGFAINKYSDEVEPWLRSVEAYYDPYEPARTIYTITREIDVEDFTWRSDESGPTQTLETIFLKAKDPHFAEIATKEKVKIGKRRELPYTVWLQREPAPLFYFVPGQGGHRIGEGSLALAEIIYETGCSVVTVSNPTNWEFVANAASVHLPGYAPVDAKDLHRAITAIDRKLEEAHPGRFTSKRLAGMSMGAFQTLYIAANEASFAEEGLVPFEVYVALDPPVNLEHGMRQLDRFYNAPMQFPEGQRSKRIDEIFGKAVVLSEGELWPGMELPFTEIEAQYLIGLAYRLELQFTILQTQERHDMGVLMTPRRKLRRAPAFREASEYSFMEYAYAFLLPYYAKRDPRITFDEAGAQRMFEDCDLRSIADGLAANERVLLVANENDFLLRPEDIVWLRELLGERAHFFPAGGHLGNLHRDSIQEVIKGLIEEKAEENGAP